ncbi:MAG: PilZ domain-containing protein [Planctomycetota bacterium]
MASDDPHNPIENLLNVLDEAALQWQVGLAAETSWQCRRDKWRRPFRVPCEVWAMTGTNGMLKHQGAHTRNISERGVALLAADPVLKGMPVEIRISVASRPRIHLAGLVAYCRSTVHDMQEIGVSLKVQQGSPVFHNNPMGAIATLSWLRDAMRNMPAQSRVKHSSHS